MWRPQTARQSPHTSGAYSGTDAAPIRCHNHHRADDIDDNLLVVDENGAITFATIELALMLGYQVGGCCMQVEALRMKECIYPIYIRMDTKGWIHKDGYIIRMDT